MTTRIRFVPAAAALALLAGCTSLSPVHRADPAVAPELLTLAAESDRPEDAAGLLLLAELAVRTPDDAPPPETVAGALEGLGRRAGAGSLPPSHQILAAEVGAALALDEFSDPLVRMTACDLLGALGRRAALRRVVEEAADPLVVEQASLALRGGDARP